MMKYSSTPNILQDNSKVIFFTMVFPYERIRENCAYDAFLEKYLSTTNFESANESSFANNFLKQNIIDYDVNIRQNGNMSFLEFDVLLPNPKYVDNMNLNDTIKYILKTIYNPYLVDDKFDDSIINKIKEKVNNSRLSFNTDIEKKYLLNTFKLVKGCHFFGYKNINHPQLMDGVNGSSMLDYYNDVIIHTPEIFIKGDVEGLDLDMFGNKEGHYDLDLFDMARNREFIVDEDKLKTTQSVTSLIYKIDGIRQEEKTLFWTIYDILSSERLLHKNLRDEEGLVYFTRVMPRFYNGLMIISPFTFNGGIERCEEIVNQTIESLQDEKLVSQYLSRVQVTNRYDYLRQLDEEENVHSTNITETLFGTSDLDRLKDLNNLSVPEVTSFVKRIKPYSISRIRGDK